MSILEAFNFLEIQNAKDAGRAARKLDDLKDEAAHLQQQGAPVVSWYDFKRTVKQEEPNYTRNIAVGAGIGAAILGGLTMLLVPAVGIPYALGSGALVGGLFGGYRETEDTKRNAGVEAYEEYLQQVKEGASLSRAPSITPRAPTPALDQPHPTVAPEVIAANAAPQKEHACGCGH